ncbi:MAG: phage portal protein, partial [Tenuifilaceae bacterium]
MTILEWLSNLFKAKRTDKLSWNEITSQIVDCISDIWAREMAFWSAVNLQAAALGQCEFRTYQNGKEVQGREYYIWNVEPNKNQNRQEWLRELVAKLYRNNEALVIDWNGDLLIADSFQRVPYA